MDPNQKQKIDDNEKLHRVLLTNEQKTRVETLMKLRKGRSVNESVYNLYKNWTIINHISKNLVIKYPAMI